MKRGEVWWAELPEPVGRRPVVLLTRDGAYGYRTMATVAPVTTTIRGIPAEVELGPADGLPRRCVVNLDNLRRRRCAGCRRRTGGCRPTAACATAGAGCSGC